MENFGPISNHADCLVAPKGDDGLGVRGYNNPMFREAQGKKPGHAFKL